MEVNIRQLEEAVTLFYQEASQQAAVHEWLTQMQKSPQAWSFCWELMRPEKSCEIQFFGATTLHSKLMKYWHEVPQEMHNELEQKLLQALIAFGSGPKIVLNRLCIAFSAYFVHTLKDRPTAVSDIINVFLNQQISNLNKNTQIWIMMEILGGIPEEANAIHTTVQRSIIKGEINKNSANVMKNIEIFMISKCDQGELDDDDMSTLLNASKCAAAWIKNINIALNDCINIASAMLKLVNKCYWNNVNNDGCMTAEESDLTESLLKTLVVTWSDELFQKKLCHFLYLLQKIMIQPDAHKFSNTALILLKMYLDSLTNIAKAEWKENNLNEDIAFGIYTLFLSSIECHSRIILAGISTNNAEHNELYMRIVNLVLQCSDKPGTYPVEESCSILATGFWYMLQDEVLSIENSIEKRKCVEAIRPVYTHLVRILVKKSQMPNELSIGKWNSDDLETFRCYRQDIADTLLFCYDILCEHVLSIISHILDEAILAIQVDINNWPQLEAVIHAYCAIAQQIELHEYEEIVKLMRILNEIPYDKLNEKLLGSALDTIGSYTEWLSENPKFLPSAIELLVKGLNSPMASQATLALKDLTTECGNELIQYSEPLLEACQRSLTNGHLKITEIIRLMYSIGNLMSLIPIEKIPIYLNVIVSPCFEELQLLVQNRDITDHSKVRVVFRLNMISTLFSSLNTTKNIKNAEIKTEGVGVDEPILLVLRKTMPILKEISLIWANDTVVIQLLCKALQQAITNLQNDIQPILNDLCYLILSILKNKCLPPVVDISGMCILMFYTTPPYEEIMKQFFIEIITSNIQLCEETPRDNLSDISGLLETFYCFNTKICKKLPAIYSDSNTDCSKLIVFALNSIMLPETGPIKKGANFIATFIKEARNYQNMNMVILNSGKDIVRTVLMCIGGITPRTQIDVFAEIFINMNMKYPSEIITWLKILETPNFPTNLVNDTEKNNFMKSIIREKVNKRLIQDHIKRFAAKSRGLVEEM